MQIERTCRLQESMEFQDTRRHIDQVGLVTLGHGSKDDAMQGRVFGFNQIDPLGIDVGEGPRVLEGGSGRFGPYGSRIVMFGIKRGIEIDEVDGRGIHAPENGQIVARPQCMICPVLASP